MKKINCILLVDDNENESYFHTYIIKDAGICNILKNVSNGEEAFLYILNSFKSHDEEMYPVPQLIFLDINMPKMNGFEFLEQYQKLDHPIKKEIVIVMLSTSDETSDRNLALRHYRVKEFITKPLNLELIYEIMEKYF